jgi:hypothetical protein
MGELEPPATPSGALSCPWCDSTDVEQLRDFGSLMMTSQWFCLSCRSQFERIRLRGSDGMDGSKDAHARGHGGTASGGRAAPTEVERGEDGHPS